MTDVRETMRQLVEEACQLHRRERGITMESVLLVGRLDRMNVAVNLWMSSKAFAKRIGLTPDMYWKRAQAARVIHFFPRAGEMVKAGETEVSHLAAVAGKITQANADVIFTGIRHQSKREVEAFLSIVTRDGRLLDKEPEVEVRVMLTQSELELLDRAREVLAARGQVPGTKDVLVKALGDLLHRRDPVGKAERDAKRKGAALGQKPERASKESDETGGAAKNVASSRSEAAAPGQRGRVARTGGRRALRAAVKHAVVRRDGGQCTEMLADGARCPERMMLEFDHTHMKCRGAGDGVDDLTQKCRRHNRARAERELGPGYMVSWEASRGLREAMTASASPPSTR